MGRHKKEEKIPEFSGHITETGIKMRDECMQKRLNTRLYNEGRRKSAIITMDHCEVSVLEINEEGVSKEIYKRQHQWHTAVWVFCRWEKTYSSKGYDVVGTQKTVEEAPKKKRGRPAGSKNKQVLNTSTEIPKA